MSIECLYLHLNYSIGHLVLYKICEEKEKILYFTFDLYPQLLSFKRSISSCIVAWNYFRAF